MIFTVACDKGEFSPHQKFDRNSPQNINVKSLKKLFNTPSDDTIRFVLSGDSQRAYDDLAPFVDKVNGIKGIDFVVMNGDISDFGLLQEMRWVNTILSRLNMPYLSVIGNHDHAANGLDVFKNMFGNPDYSFIYKKVKFICHNTNSREYNFNGTVPNLNWLANELKPDKAVEGYVGISHVPSYNNDFDPNLREEYGNLLTSANNVYAVLNAHIDKTETQYPYTEDLPFIVTNSIYNRQFIIAEIYNNKMTTHVIKY